MSDTDLVQYIYTSCLSPGLDGSVLDDILAKARHNNAQLGVTGMLLFEDGSFLQVLEGPAPVVADLFERIEADDRHRQVVKLIVEPIEERSFGSWSMGRADVTRSELATIDGLNDFFANGHSFHRLDGGRAKELLAAFRKGRFHNRLS